MKVPPPSPEEEARMEDYRRSAAMSEPMDLTTDERCRVHRRHCELCQHDHDALRALVQAAQKLSDAGTPPRELLNVWREFRNALANPAIVALGKEEK